MSPAYNYWTIDKCREVAANFRSKKEFMDVEGKAYCAAYRNGWLESICSHMDLSNKIWTFEICAEEALKYRSRVEFKEKTPGGYSAACKRGWIDQICSHMDLLISRPWCLESSKNEALKFKTRAEMRSSNPGLYNSCCNNGWLEEVCSHMERIYEGHTIYMCQKVASTCKTREEFHRKHANFYMAAFRHGWLEEICAHMPKSTNSSEAERQLFGTIKEAIPSARKLKKTHIHLEEHPNIKGFEVDIFVPELNKGIEFDGDYWHSFDVMRKSDGKAKWPDEDIANYHHIKDEYFKSIGIQILHIKEKDWISDQEGCILRCLAFLES
jgi:hypothetical protein